MSQVLHTKSTGQKRTRFLNSLIALTVYLALPTQTILANDNSGPGDTPPPPSSKTTLLVQEGSGDLQQWVKELIISQPEVLLFGCTTEEPGTGSFYWEVTDSPWGFPDPYSPVLEVEMANIVASGIWDIPTDNSVVDVVDFTKFLPPQAPQTPKSYFIRATPMQDSGRAGSQPYPIGLPSNEVEIIYQQATQSETRFTNEGLFPELFEPLPVTVHFGNLEVVEADEEDDEEPYLLAAAIYVDGTTIDPLDFPNSTVRIDSMKGTHGNLPYTDDFGSGDSCAVSFDSQQTILPIAIELADTLGLDVSFLLENTRVFIVAVGLEEDATDTSTAELARETFLEALQEEINQLVQNFTPGQTITDDDIQTIQDNIEDEVLEAVSDDVTSGLWNPFGAILALDDIVDPDDLIGFGFTSVSYADLVEAGIVGFELDLQNDDGVHYQVSGSVQAQ